MGSRIQIGQKSRKSYKNALNSMRWNFMRWSGTEQGIFQLVGLAYSRQFTVWALTISLRQVGYFFRSKETKWQVMNSPPFRKFFWYTSKTILGLFAGRIEIFVSLHKSPHLLYNSSEGAEVKASNFSDFDLAPRRNEKFGYFGLDLL